MTLGRAARASAVVATALLGTALAVRAAPGPPPPTYDGLLAWLAGWALVLGAGWLGLVTAAVAVGSLTVGSPEHGSPADVPPADGSAACGATWARALRAPAVWRRLVLLLCGVAAATTVVVPAHAERRRVPLPALATTGLPLPSRPAGRSPVPPEDAPGPRAVVVRPGDSLWRLADAVLPAGAGDGQVAALVAQTYAANRAVIGADPDLLQPGTHLLLPPPTDERHRR